ncbi:hypothetical protein DSO57_1028350 [Entomophthora muscae]|uniref:Uncharacterized protein n=1 Tax=Entomophthora muscae TaxID=34485 RepID=A0ACC2UN58_9FUNG|nr:hypothetical protein DSO57_1028350 [Entomophthora muscae]
MDSLSYLKLPALGISSTKATGPNKFPQDIAPATLCQPPAGLLPAQPAARKPPACQPTCPAPTGHLLAHPFPSGPPASSQAPFPSQSEATIQNNQSEKYLPTGQNPGNNFCPAEERPNQSEESKNNLEPSQNRSNQIPKVKNNLTSSQWDSEDHNPCLGLGPSQTNLSKPKIDLGSPMSFSHQLTSQPGDIIGSRHEWPNLQ